MLRLAVDPSGTKFLRALTRRGLRGVKLVIADAHKVLNAAQRQMVVAAIRTAFTQETVALGRQAQPSGQVHSGCASTRLRS